MLAGQVMGTRIYLFCVSCFIWFSLTGFSWDRSVVITAVCVSAIIVLLIHKLAISSSYNKIFWGRSFGYVRWLLKEVFNSAFQVSNIAWRKNIFLRPVLEQINANQVTDLGVVIYANSITITPGTVTIANQGNELLVHALDVSFVEDLQTGQMEQKVKKIIRPN